MSRPAKSATTAPKSLPPHPRLARGHRVQRGHDRNRVRGRKDQPVRRSIRDWPPVGRRAREFAGDQLPDRCPKLSKEGTVKAMVKLFALGAAAAGALVLSAGVGQAQLLITDNDEKVRFDPATGKTVNQAPGKDTVSIIDIHAVCCGHEPG